MGMRHATWIHPEENLLSALIRPPSRPENDALDLKLETDTGLRGETPGKFATQEWPHPNTATMSRYLLIMRWKTSYLLRLRSVNTQWKAAIDSSDINYFDFRSCCQGEVQPCNIDWDCFGQEI